MKFAVTHEIPVTIAVTVASKTVTAVTVNFARRLKFSRFFAAFAWLLQQPSLDHPLSTSLSQVILCLDGVVKRTLRLLVRLYQAAGISGLSYVRIYTGSRGIISL